jgi:dihydroorotate dehydrogenase electron transfer subunit
MEQSLCTVVSSREVLPGSFSMWLEAPGIAANVQPGQYITILCNGFTLRRPFSVHQVISGQICILFKVLGKGTTWLSKQPKGTELDVLGPLGKGFTLLPDTKNLLLLAGGAGIAPLVYLIQHASAGHSITLIHGVNTANQLYPYELLSSIINPHTEDKRLNTCNNSSRPEYFQYVTVSEDGSSGKKGRVTDVLADFLDWADQVFACGPINMYVTMSGRANDIDMLGLSDNFRQTKLTNRLKLLKCQLSLELRLGCGTGACYGCSINTKNGMKKVCSDGPVFELDQIVWDEIRI